MKFESEKRALKRAEARSEFLALKEAVDVRLQSGFSVRTVYNYLKQKGELSMSYSTFNRYIQRSSNGNAPAERCK